MSDCIEWTGCLGNKGYGQRLIKGKSYLTHRLAYVEHHGLSIEDIDGMLVCHRCDNPPCLNPGHLFLGTHKDNMADMYAKGRENPPRGSRNHTSKLTEADIPIIRQMLSVGMTQVSIAKRFGVWQTAISKIKRGVRWSHI